MKALFYILFYTVCFLFLVFVECKKDVSGEGCASNKESKPPIAIAGPDQLITLPTDSILLDVRTSSDPDGSISSYFWTKISGLLLLASFIHPIHLVFYLALLFKL